MKKLIVAVLLVSLVVGILSGVILSSYFLIELKPGIENGRIEELYSQIDDKSIKIANLIETNIAIRDANSELKQTHQHNIFDLKNRAEDLQAALDNAKRDRERLIRAHLKAYEVAKEQFNDRNDELTDQNEALVNEIEDLRVAVGVNVTDWGETRNFNSVQEFLEAHIRIRTAILAYGEGMECPQFTLLYMRQMAEQGYRAYPVPFITLQGNRILRAHLCNMVIVSVTLEDGTEAKRCIVIEPQTMEWLYFGYWEDPDSWREKLVPFLP